MCVQLSCSPPSIAAQSSVATNDNARKTRWSVSNVSRTRSRRTRVSVNVGAVKRSTVHVHTSLTARLYIAGYIAIAKDRRKEVAATREAILPEWWAIWITLLHSRCQPMSFKSLGLHARIVCRPAGRAALIDLHPLRLAQARIKLSATCSKCILGVAIVMLIHN